MEHDWKKATLKPEVAAKTVMRQISQVTWPSHLNVRGYFHRKYRMCYI